MEMRKQKFALARPSRGRLIAKRWRILAFRCERLERREVFADFGDAPEPYPTLLADNGASHSVVPGFFLGLGVDEEPNGIPSLFGDGDEQDGTVPDEDGISFPQEFVVGSAVEILVLASAPGKLSAWFDWNADGDWNDADEAVFTGKTIAAGESKISINVPATATLNKFQAARFRFSSQTVSSPTGPALDGEVEDYVLTVSSRPELRGRKFNDLDRDHERDANEPYLNGWLIEAIDSEGNVVATATTADVDLNSDGSIDIDTERGVWRLFDLPPGTYTIREAARPEHIRTAPDLTAFLQGNAGPNPSGATSVGFASFTYNPSTNQVAFRVDYDSLVGALIKVSLHDGDTTQNGPIIADLLAAAGASPGADGPISGHLTLDNTQLAKLLAGQCYVRIDTDTFDMFGELRGQVMPSREYTLMLGLYTQLIGLDFGGYTAESRNSVYPGTQGQVVLSLPDLSTATLPLVGSSTFKLYVPNNGAAGDFDLDGREEAALELSILSLRGYSTLGQVDIALQPAAASTGLAEERTNSTPGVLDLPPFAVSGSVDQQLSFDVLVTVTNRGLTPVVLRSATPISLAGISTGFPMAVGEIMAGTGAIDLVDGAGMPTGLRLTAVALSPNPILPWRNPILALDVDNSGGIEPFDALLVINELNNPRFSNGNALPRPVNSALTTFPFFDANGNNTIDPQDALFIINRLNGIGSSGELAEGESRVEGRAEAGMAIGVPTTPNESTAAFSARLWSEIAAENALTIGIGVMRWPLAVAPPPSPVFFHDDQWNLGCRLTGIASASGAATDVEFCLGESISEEEAVHDLSKGAHQSGNEEAVDNALAALMNSSGSQDNHELIESDRLNS